jgi:hypothetical protein
MKITYEFREPEDGEERQVFENAYIYKDCLSDIDEIIATTINRYQELRSNAEDPPFSEADVALKGLTDILTWHFSQLEDVLESCEPYNTGLIR